MENKKRRQFLEATLRAKSRDLKSLLRQSRGIAYKCAILKLQKQILEIETRLAEL